MDNTVFVTGGAGFIGSAVVRQLIRETDWVVVNIDKLTYAGNLASVACAANSPRYRFEHADICDAPRLRGLLREYRPTAIMHLAAESHVDRSIDGPAEFIHTNVVGTGVLLEAAREYWRGLAAAAAAAFRFHHISTDEVFGSLGLTGYFTETTPYQPRSPYSASKAASDHLVRAWHDTYGLPILVSNCSNNYGPYQFPEKLIPVIIDQALVEQPVPVYGQGANVRDWLYVADHARALHTILTRGEAGATYNVGGDSERANLQVVEAVCGVLDEIRPAADGPRFPRLVQYVADRPGHDFRYAIDAGKIRRELGWQPQESFTSGIRKTVEWYLDNHAWVAQVTDGSYRGQRLGLGHNTPAY